jgi:hypothetical protein
MKILLDVLVATVFGVFLAVLFAEWMVGCGETYVDARGIRHQNECLFVNR